MTVWFSRQGKKYVLRTGRRAGGDANAPSNDRLFYGISPCDVYGSNRALGDEMQSPPERERREDFRKNIHCTLYTLYIEDSVRRTLYAISCFRLTVQVQGTRALLVVASVLSLLLAGE